MKTKDFVSNLNPTRFYVLDTKVNGLIDTIVDDGGEKNYTRYFYETNKYNKLVEGGAFIYRQPIDSCNNNKFYFFGGGIIKSILKTRGHGVVAVIENGFRLLKPIYQDNPKLLSINWTSKNKKATWAHFWNQYGMNEITEDEFYSIIDDTDCDPVLPCDLSSYLPNIGEEESEDDTTNLDASSFTPTYYDNNSKYDYYDKKKVGVVHKTDYEKLNQYKNKIGKMGEVLIYNEEVKKLSSLNIGKKPEHVSVTKGDGLGYDILSYDANGDELFIEVKTTKTNKSDGFYLSSNELKTAEDNQAKYKIYRVFNLDTTNKTYDVQIIEGNISKMYDLKTVSVFVTKKRD